VCDTIVVVPEHGAVWLAKNSDREPGEAQAVEWIAGSTAGSGTRPCTHVAVEAPASRHAVVLSRPVWMWGAEMGVNDRGVAIGNEAVFTREPVATTGLTGMDLLRLALEQAGSADEALEVITALLERHEQGGRMAHRGGLRYHSSFAIADPRGAWILETAGRFWAARRVFGPATISNALGIGTDFDRIHPGAAEHARRRGWARPGEPLHFARAFGDPRLAIATGAALRRACTLRAVSGVGASSELAPQLFADALSSHAGHAPRDGWRMQMPCAHASYLPTRTAGQTTGSMIARLDASPSVWMTGTSAPCLGVYKPVPLHADVTRGEPPVREHADAESLWWRHERLHRAVLMDYAARADALAPALSRLRAAAWSATTEADAAAVWSEHRAAIADLVRTAESVPRGSRRGAFEAWWGRQSRRDGLQG
jgi:secernin